MKLIFLLDRLRQHAFARLQLTSQVWLIISRSLRISSGIVCRIFRQIYKPCRTNKLVEGKYYQKRPFWIPLLRQDWPSFGPYIPPALETTGHSSLQEPMHLMILKSVVSTVSSLRSYYCTYLLNSLTRISFTYWSVALASPS